LLPIDEARVYYEMGEAYSLDNKIDKAITSYKNSLFILGGMDDSIEVLDLRGLNKYNLFLLSADEAGDRYAKEAICIFKRLIENFGSIEKPLMTCSYLADIFYRIGDYDNALHYYSLALEDSDDIQKFWVFSGITAIYSKKNNIDEAILYFNKALSHADINSPVSQLYYDMGMMYFDANMLDDSYNAFQMALKSKDKETVLKKNIEYEIEILWHMLSIAYETNEFINITCHFEKLKSLINSDHHYYANTHLKLGHYFFMKGENTKAIDHYNNVLSAPMAAKEEIKIAKDCLKKIPFDA
jgi:tetratricopeptide (TPR) repeat protein